MSKPRIQLDLTMYLKAIPQLFRHPSILACPLLAAVVDVLLDLLSRYFTDAMGGMGASIFSMIAQLVYLWAFGMAIIQASNIWRGRRGSFDEAWDEGRSKFGSILLGAIGFQFVFWAASYIGSFIGPLVGLILGIVAAFFLIYTMPAAAIGGMPGGSMAISASIRGVRANPVASLILAAVFVALWVVVPIYLPYLLAMTGAPAIVWSLSMAAVRAAILAYLAFPFAKQYDDVAFTRFW